MIEILPESQGNVLVVKASAKLTTQDYEEVFIPKLEDIIAEHGKVRVVLWLTEQFTGWELGAMWDDAKFGVKHRHDCERVALVGGPTWVEWATRLSAHFLEGQIKTFEDVHLQEALVWICEEEA